MSINLVNLGTFANDGTGDDLRTAFEKVNGNFTALDNITISNATNLGTGAPLFAGKAASSAVGDNLTFRSIRNGANIQVSYDGTSITIASTATFTGQVSDISNHDISDLGDVSSVAPTSGQALVWQGSTWGPGNVDTSSLDFSFPSFNGTFTTPVQFLLGQIDMDFGAFILTSFDTGLDLDLGTF